MTVDAMLQILFQTLQIVLPPLIVEWVTNVFKRWQPGLTPKQITTYVVPGFSLVLSLLNALILDANFIWSFLLSMLSIALYEFKKNLTEANQSTLQ